MTPQRTNTYAMQIAASMTPTQQGLFYGEYMHRAKDYNTALLWAILTGWWAGGHNFYLGRVGRGILHIVLFLLAVSAIIPIVVTVVDIINLHKIVDGINEKIANEVAAHVRALTPGE